MFGRNIAESTSAEGGEGTSDAGLSAQTSEHVDENRAWSALDESRFIDLLVFLVSVCARNRHIPEEAARTNHEISLSVTDFAGDESYDPGAGYHSDNDIGHVSVQLLSR